MMHTHASRIAHQGQWPAPTTPRCAYCGNRLIRTGLKPGRNPVEAQHRYTRDHIMPRAWRVCLPAGVQVTRIACQTCNQLRAMLGHCPAMLAIAKALADRFRFGSRDEAARRLLMPVPGMGGRIEG